MKQIRDIGMLVLLFAALIGFVVYGPARNRPDADGKPGSAHNLGDDGTLGLQLWLRSLGYQATNLEYDEWRIPPATAALLVIAPRDFAFDEAERDATLAWVRKGGTLIYIADRVASNGFPLPLWETLGARVVAPADTTKPAERADASQPLFDVPPVSSVAVRTDLHIALDEPGFVTLLETRFGPALVGRQEGRGYVYLGVSAVPFTNQGIQEAGGGALVLNLLRRIPAAGAVLFDEYHHGYRVVPTPQGALAKQWWGWSLIYAAFVVAGYLLLGGRRFGRAVPVRQEVARRSSAEYVASMANLFQRAGKRHDIATHYRTMLKRRLAQPYGFAPPADDQAFLEQLERWGDLDAAQHQRVASLLTELRDPKINEMQLLRLTRAADALTDPKGRIRR